MARRNRPSQVKREREQKKRERQRRKAEKAAEKRERRFGQREADAGSPDIQEQAEPEQPNEDSTPLPQP